MLSKLHGAISGFLALTAWPMDPPEPYSLFHLSFSAAGILAAVFFAYVLTRPGVGQKNGPVRSLPCGRGQSRAFGVLFFCGLLLAGAEIYKQLFLYEIVYSGSYNWFYFPFQLCSIPMYLCLLLPLFRKKKKSLSVLCTFLADFSLLGGVMALLEPSGLMYPYWTLTLHGLSWHVMLIFIGLYTAFSGLSGRRAADYLPALPLLALLCLAATAINTATHGQANMFYISPYYPITQVVFHQISLRLGIPAGIAVYVGSLCAGGFLSHMLLCLSRKWRP